MLYFKVMCMFFKQHLKYYGNAVVKQNGLNIKYYNFIQNCNWRISYYFIPKFVKEFVKLVSSVG